MSAWTLVASGLEDFGGHNFTYTDIVRDALKARGVTTRVLASRRMEEGFAREHGLERVFSRGAYTFPKPGALNALRAWRQWSRTFEREMTPFLDAPTRGVFSHTFGEFELGAWTRLSRCLAPSTELVLLVRVTPGYATLPRWKRALHPALRHTPSCLAAIRGSLGDRFRLVTDSEELTEDLKTVYTGPVETFPIPIDPEVLNIARADSKWASHELTLGFMGDGRTAKGFPLLPQLVGPLGERSDLRLLSQCSAPPSTDEGFDRASALLRQAGTDRVVLVDGRLSRHDYAELVAAMDIVLVPYLAPGYRRSTSGIFAEAVAAGKPVVVPSESWMAAELGRGRGAGETYPRDHPEAFQGACLRAVDRFQELKRQAVSAAIPYRSHHSAETLAGMLLRSTHPAIDKHRIA